MEISPSKTLTKLQGIEQGAGLDGFGVIKFSQGRQAFGNQLSRRDSLNVSLRMLLPLLILASLCYLVFAVTSVMRQRSSGEPIADDSLHPVAKFLFAGGVPILVTATMIYLFLIAGGATTVQFNAGSPSRMNVWSTWVSIWPIFLFLTAASSLGALIWLLVCSIKKSSRVSISVPLISCLLSVLAFFTVASYFPSA